MALTGSGLRVPRGPLGFLAGLIDGLQPSMPAIQAQQQRRRDEAAAKKAAKEAKEAVNSPVPKPGGGKPSTPLPGANYVPPGYPPPPEGPSEAELDFEYWLGGGRPETDPGPAGDSKPAPDLPEQGFAPARPAGGFRTVHAGGGMGQLARALHEAPAGAAGTGLTLRRVASGRPVSAAARRSDAERYASYLREAGMPGARMRRTPGGE